MAGLLGLSPSSVQSPPSVAATQTPAPATQQTWGAPQQQPISTFDTSALTRSLSAQSWSPAQPQTAQPVTSTNNTTPTTSTPTQQQPLGMQQQTPDYFQQFFSSIASIFNPQPQAPAPTANTPTTQVNPNATGLLQQNAMVRPAWVGEDNLTTQPDLTPYRAPPAPPPTVTQQQPIQTTPTSPWAAGWDPYAEYEKKNAGMMTAKDSVTGRMYNPWAHPYLKPGQSPFGNIDARGFVTVQGGDEDDFARWQRMNQEGSRG